MRKVIVVLSLVTCIFIWLITWNFSGSSDKSDSQNDSVTAKENQSSARASLSDDGEIEGNKKNTSLQSGAPSAGLSKGDLARLRALYLKSRLQAEDEQESLFSDNPDEEGDDTLSEDGEDSTDGDNDGDNEGVDEGVDEGNEGNDDDDDDDDNDNDGDNETDSSKTYTALLSKLEARFQDDGREDAAATEDMREFMTTQMVDLDVPQEKLASVKCQPEVCRTEFDVSNPKGSGTIIRVLYGEWGKDFTYSVQLGDTGLPVSVVAYFARDSFDLDAVPPS